MTGKSFADELASLPDVLARSPVVKDQLSAGLSRRFELLGMGDVDMDFAGRSQDAAVQRAITELKNGDELVIEPPSGQQRWAIKTVTGQIVGHNRSGFPATSGANCHPRVAAICVRRLQDGTTKWQPSMVLAEWEGVLPALVVVH
ncbi:MAG: hypothetical protein ACLQHK_12550 [Gallionellaceae bacterium]